MTTSIIGIDKLYFAPMQDEQKETYYKPVQIGYVKELSVEPEVESVSDYGDNRAIESASAMGSIPAKLVLTGIQPDREALVLGHKYSKTNKTLIKSAEDVAPQGALLYRRMKADGSYRYKVLYKGRFALGKEETKTKEDKVEFQSPEYEISFMPRLKDSVYEFQIDANKATTQTPDNWAVDFFKGVVEPSDAPKPPTTEPPLPPGIESAELVSSTPTP